MADLYTDSAALTDTIKTSYDRNAMFALRHELVFAQLATVRPGNVTSPGTPVTFTFWSDLSDATTPLSETVDVVREMATTLLSASRIRKDVIN